jgi:predicted SAM-dependent methyltransferase
MLRKFARTIAEWQQPKGMAAEVSGGPLFPCGEKIPVMEGGEPLVLWRDADTLQCWRCGDCGYMFFDIPDLDFLNAYYQDEYPKAAAPWYNPENDYHPSRYAERVALVTEAARTFLLTDQVAYHESGCAFGGTVAALRDMGHDATGTELNSDAVARGRARGNEWISDETDTRFLARVGRQPDLLYCFHAVEHMPDPVAYLRDVRSVLSPRGIACIVVPNAVSAAAMHKGYHGHPWFAYPDHLHLLSPRSLLCLARKAGFEVLRVDSRKVGADATDDSIILGGEADARRSRLGRQVIEQTLMGVELRAILTPIGSLTARRSSAKIEETQARCMLSGEAERALLEAYAEP